MKSAIKLLICFLCITSFAYARVDVHTYTKDVDVLAVWINPKKVKVFIEEAPKSHILRNAVKIWDDSLRSDLNFVFVKNKNEADITIKYVEQLGENRMGVTQSSHIEIQGRIYLHKAHVSISRKDPIGFINNDAELLKTTLHELGHAIGILGHSSSMYDIMYYSSASTKNTSPSLKDIETVKKMYGF